MITRMLWPLALVLVAWMVWAVPATTQEADTDPPNAAEQTNPAEATVTPDPIEVQDDDFRGRLPPYYAQLVDGLQREKIYTIQAEYHDPISELKAKIATLEAERDKKIEDVLRPDQKARLKELLERAKARSEQSR